MKTLYIIRHAKSSWSFDLKDFDRPVGKRGRKDVLKMGKYLNDTFKCPQLLLTSSASRALYTCLYIADKWGYDEENIALEPQFYLGSTDDFIRVLTKLHDEETVAVFGHNPGLTDLSNKLCDSYIDNIPTCGVVRIEFGISHWNDLKEKQGNLMDFIKPKEIP